MEGSEEQASADAVSDDRDARNSPKLRIIDNLECMITAVERKGERLLTWAQLLPNAFERA